MAQMRKVNEIVVAIIIIVVIVNSFILIVSDTLTLDVFLYANFFGFFSGMPLFLVFKYLTIYLDKRFPWLEMPVRRLVFGFVLQSVILLAIVFIVSYLFFLLIEGNNDLQLVYSQSIGAFKIGMGFIIASTFIVNGVMFFLKWKESALNEERLKREAISHQYDALKNQVNPHFLFNNLTALSSLIYENQDKASEFVRQLSSVYRYVLEQKDKELTLLTTELEFLDSYIYLYKIRHEDNLLVTKIIEPKAHNKACIIPLCLQMVMENAIKHNIITETQKLRIDIMLQDDYLMVSNNLQLKAGRPSGSGIGLENIKSRYTYLTDKPVIIENNGQKYSVKIPLIFEA
ncbi:MAG: sensor histidine kinase [Bacteroidota bacterium]